MKMVSPSPSWFSHVKSRLKRLRSPKTLRRLNFDIVHTVHHRGQLSVYLRLLDVPVPSIYGPSADESPFQAQA